MLRPVSRIQARYWLGIQSLQAQLLLLWQRWVSQRVPPGYHEKLENVQ